MLNSCLVLEDFRDSPLNLGHISAPIHTSQQINVLMSDFHNSELKLSLSNARPGLAVANLAEKDNTLEMMI